MNLLGPIRPHGPDHVPDLARERDEDLARVRDWVLAQVRDRHLARDNISRVGHILEWGIDMNVDDGIGIAIAEVHMQNCLAETMLLFWCSICLSSFPWRLSKAEEVEENNNVSDRVLNPQRSERRTQCCLLRREWIGVPLKKPSRLLEHTV